MAPRGSESPAPRARKAALIATALLVPLLLSSLPVTDAAASSPSPAPSPAPAPLRHSLPPHAAPGGGGSKPHAGPLRPGPRHQSPRRRPPPPVRSSWWQRLNFGERFGIALAAVAVAMQVALGAFLCVRARQLRQAAARGKPEEHEDEAAAASSSAPTPV